MSEVPIQQALIAALRDSAHYPHPARNVRLVETHISWVLLAGRYAYKIKKAVNLGFLDFSTLAQRRFYCEEELRLNRRLAPQLYLDVVPVGGTPQLPLFGGEPAIEYAVRMRRFPATHMMDTLLRRGRVEPRHIDGLAAMVAQFHAGLPTPATESQQGRVASIRTAALQNFEALSVAFADQAMLEGLRAASMTAWAKGESLFEQRRAQGYVRECHGDLHCGNIVLLGDALVPFDSLEFNPELRWIDVMSETAFIMMDLLYRGQAQYAWRFINAYLDHSGDYAGVAVLRFYLAYRATVRAKVAAIRAQQPGQTPRVLRKELDECHRHLVLAQHCLTPQRPALVITHGLPGCGKSTFAQMALERYGAIRIRSDVERKRLFGLQPLENSRSAAGEGIYSHEATRRTYARLHALAQQILAAGYPVIVDAAFIKREERAAFGELAREMRVPFVIAGIQAGEATLRARIAQRQALQQDASEADLPVLHALSPLLQPLDAAERTDAILFDNESENALLSAPAWGELDRRMYR